MKHFHTNQWDQWEIRLDFPTEELLIKHKNDFHSQKSSPSIDLKLE